MLETKRKIKRRRKKKVFLFLVCTLFIIAAAILTYYLYFLKSQKPLYITPISSGFSFSKPINDEQMESIKKGTYKLHLSVDKITKSDGFYSVFLTDKSIIIFSSKKDINSQLASLQLMLSRLTMEGKLFNKLDLRFDKPVITLRK